MYPRPSDGTLRLAAGTRTGAATQERSQDACQVLEVNRRGCPRPGPGAHPPLHIPPAALAIMVAATTLAACAGRAPSGSPIGKVTPGIGSTAGAAIAEDAGSGAAQSEPSPAITGAGASAVAGDGNEDALVAAMDARWPTETLNSEAQAVKKVILDSLASGEPLGRDSATIFSADFQGEDLSDRGGSSLGTPSGVRLTSWQFRPADLSATAFIAALNAYLAEFASVASTDVHTWELQLLDAPPGHVALEAKEAVWIVGLLADGRVRQDRFLLVFELQRGEESVGDWSVTAITTEEGRTAVAAGPYFHDVTASVLPAGRDQTGAQIYTDGGPAMADFDGDGDVDLFVPRIHAPARLYENDGTGHFADTTAGRGLGGPALATGTNSAVFFDYDGDGGLDLVVGRKAQGLRLFHNDGPFFTDVTGAADLGGPGEWESLAVADADGDGRLDIYATNYNLIDADHQPESYVDAQDGLPNVLLKNEGNGRITDVTSDAGLGADNDRWSYAAAWADYDRDGDMDLYVANDYGPNALYQNDGRGHFTDVATAVGAVDFGNGMGASWLDYNNDLRLDLYVSNMQSFAGNRITRLKDFPGTEDQQRLYRRFSQGNTLLSSGEDGLFRDVTDDANVRSGFWSWGSAPFDYDSDGDTDIFVAAGFYTGDSTADT